jgi:hypothetical protein
MQLTPGGRLAANLVLVITTILDMAALAFIIALFLIKLVTWATRKRLYSWGRHVDRAPGDMSFSLLHAPMIAASTAIGTGVSINYLTDASSSIATYAQGAVGMFICPLIMVSVSVRLIRRATDRRNGIPLVRNRLARCLACRTRCPSDLDRALAWLDRVQRFGDRLTARAERLTFRRWTQRHPRASRLMAIAWLLDAVAVTAMLVGSSRGWDINRPQNLATFLLSCAALVMGPTALVLWWQTDRWWLLSVGAELTTEARRAEKNLMRFVHPDGLRQRLRRWMDKHQQQAPGDPIID